MLTVNRVPAVMVVLGLVVAVGSGCEAATQALRAPFAAEEGMSSGPSSGLWGDGSSGPKGMEIGCIDGRRFAVVITVRNRTKRTITLLGGGGWQGSPGTRVAVQVSPCTASHGGSIAARTTGVDWPEVAARGGTGRPERVGAVKLSDAELPVASAQ